MTDDVVEVKVRSGGKELSNEPVKCVLSVNRWLKSSSAKAFWFLFSQICFVLRIYLLRSLLARRNSPQTCNSSHVDSAWDRSFGRMVRKVVSTQHRNAGTWLTRKIAMNVRCFSKYNMIFVYFKDRWWIGRPCEAGNADFRCISELSLVALISSGALDIAGRNLVGGEAKWKVWPLKIRRWNVRVGLLDVIPWDLTQGSQWQTLSVWTVWKDLEMGTWNHRPTYQCVTFF